MTNLALEETAYSTYSLEDASKDAALLHKLNRKATLATAMIDQEIAALQQDLRMLEGRRKEILEPLEGEMERLKGNLTEYHRRTLEAGGDKTIKLPWATLKKAGSSRRIMTKLRMSCFPGRRPMRRNS